MDLIAIIGPMFGGKTTYGLTQLAILRQLGRKTLYVTYNKDDRFDSNDIVKSSKVNCVETHQGLYVSDNINHKIRITSMQELVDDDIIYDFDVLCIDEAQFYSDLPEAINRLSIIWSGTIYICGLLGSFELKSFGRIHEILYLCSDIIFVKSFCTVCNNNGILKHASFTARHHELGTELEIIGGSEYYYPTCYDHHPCTIKNLS